MDFRVWILRWALPIAACAGVACVSGGGDDPIEADDSDGVAPDGGTAADDATTEGSVDGADAGRGSALADPALSDVRDGRASDASAGDGDDAPAGDGDGDGTAGGDGDASGDGDAVSGDDPPAAGGDGDSAPPVRDDLCGLGKPDDITGNFFDALEPGDTIPMIGLGQAELSIDLAILVYMADQHDIDIVVEVDESGRTASFSAAAASDFTCGDSGWCDWVGVLIDASPLVDDPFDLMRLPVTVTLTVSDELGIYCQTSFSGPLLRRE